MRDGIGGILALAGAVGLCAACALGPAFLATAAAWISGTLGALSPMVTAGIALAAGLAAYALFRAWGRRDDARPGSGGEAPDGSVR